MEGIKTGQYPPGSKLPTERYLASQLGISRNTISAAYKDLLLEGILEARQGRGTFVKARSETPAEGAGRRQRLLKIIDDAMAQVAELGFSPEQFAAFATVRAREAQEGARRLRLAVVDCTREHACHFARQIEQTMDAAAEAATLDELTSGQVPVDFLRTSHLVVTTYEHQAEVIKLLGDSSKVQAVATVPHLESVVRLARQPAGQTVGVVAGTHRFLEALQRLMTRVGVSSITLEPAIGLEKTELARFAAAHPVLVAAEEYLPLVRSIAADNDIIPFYYEIDHGSLQQLQATIINKTLEAKE